MSVAGLPIREYLWRRTCVLDLTFRSYCMQNAVVAWLTGQCNTLVGDVESIVAAVVTLLADV
jgi:hypothetical protein